MTRKRNQSAADKQRGMTAYTRWWIKYPWHVTGTPESGEVPENCDCGCKESVCQT